MGKSVKEVETVIERVESDAKSTKARAYIRAQRDASSNYASRGRF